ncbi:MAG: hypothetical protein M1524_00980 [Patescibacteria group bacterium]|nr:hypothetical protein [Patescibacteria group bacterium]
MISEREANREALSRTEIDHEFQRLYGTFLRQGCEPMFQMMRSYLRSISLLDNSHVAGRATEALTYFEQMPAFISNLINTRGKLVPLGDGDIIEFSGSNGVEPLRAKASVTPTIASRIVGATKHSLENPHSIIKVFTGEALKHHPEARDNALGLSSASLSLERYLMPLTAHNFKGDPRPFTAVVDSYDGKVDVYFGDERLNPYALLACQTD